MFLQIVHSVECIVVFYVFLYMLAFSKTSSLLCDIHFYGFDTTPNIVVELAYPLAYMHVNISHFLIALLFDSLL